MGSVTRAKLLGHVKEEEVINYICHNWDKDVKSRIRYYSYNDWKGKDFIKKHMKKICMREVVS